MPQFRVDTSFTLKAKAPIEAAQKAYALHQSVTPEDYQVYDMTNVQVADLILSHEQKAEAVERYEAGEYFKEVNINEIKA